MSEYEKRYFYPGTTTFINNFGIRDPEALQQVEADLTKALFIAPPKFDFRTEAGLQSAHRQVFEVLYPWAGEYRAETIIRVGEGGRDDVQFTEGPFVASNMAKFYKALREDMSAGAFANLERQTFAYRAAVYVADLNQIHPFPDGNGRVQRLFLAELSRDSGFRLDHTKYDKDSWIDASIDSRKNALYDQRGNLTGLTKEAKMPSLIGGTLSERERNRDRARSREDDENHR